MSEDQGNSTSCIEKSVDSEKMRVLLEFEKQFNEKVDEHYRNRKETVKKEWTQEYIQFVTNEIRQFKFADAGEQKKTRSSYYFASKYDIMEIANEEILIFKIKQQGDPIIRIVPREEYFEK